MVTLNFILSDGSHKSVEAAEGHSVMEAAIAHSVPGIVAECGGSMARATCHVFVDPVPSESVAGPEKDEDEMLDFVAVERQENSRLSCQIGVARWMHGATITVPPKQT